MGKKKRNTSNQQKEKPSGSEMADKDGESADHGHHYNVSLADMRNCEKIFEHVISNLKLGKQYKVKKDQDQDPDQDQPDPSGCKEREILLRLEQQLRILKLKIAIREKEQPEDEGNVEKKQIEGLDDELDAMALKLETSAKRTIQRISEMNKYKDSGSVTTAELEKIQGSGERLTSYLQNFDRLLALLMSDLIPPADGKGNPVSQGLKRIKDKIARDLAAVENMEKSLDHLEEKFQKYNLPKREVRSSESLDHYLARLREFMQSTWKDAAVKCRQKEHRSFIEWMLKLEQSEDIGKRTTFKGLKRGVFENIGIQISRFLIMYFWLMSVSAKKEEIAANLFEVKSVIGCIIIEENSVVINNFISVVEFFDQTMRLANPFWDEKAKGNGKEIEVIEKGNSQIEKENDVLHLIIVEILRLEVAFLHPDLPMMLINEVYFAMGTHLVLNVFKDKFDRIHYKIIEELMSEFLSDQLEDSITNIFQKQFHLGLRKIWNKTELDLKSRASRARLVSQERLAIRVPIDDALIRCNSFCIIELHQKYCENLSTLSDHKETVLCAYETQGMAS